jgi:hypothetical protein
MKFPSRGQNIAAARIGIVLFDDDDLVGVI